MNIKEAQQKFCPIVKLKCLTSDCMMWKFSTIYDSIKPATGLRAIMPPAPIGSSDTDGDCRMKS